jgi:hypothetical protein
MGIGRHRGLLLAVLVSAAVIATRELEYFAVAYDRFHLPAFDGHVYVAMAERPGFFTVAPWGYRVLHPWLIRAMTLPFRDLVPAFFWSTVLCLGAGGVLFFLYSRRLGHGELPALLGVTLFGVSGPVGEAVRYQFLAEPLTFLLEMALLLGLESAAPLGLLALFAVLGALSKEFFLLLLPLVYLVRRDRSGDRRALRDAVVVALPAVLVTIALRRYWTPHIHPPLPDLSPGTLAVALGRFGQTWRDWRGAALLTGLTPLAVLGGLRGPGRRLVLRGAYLFVATIASPLVNPVMFLSTDIHRLLLYALPGVIPLALVALDAVAPHVTAPAPSREARPWVSRIALAATAAAMVVPFGIVDRYRRVDLQGMRDATVMLAIFRGSLDTAADLEAGEEFAFDSSAGRYSRGISRPFDLSELRSVRWFLGDGWGPRAPRRAGDAVMEGAEATLLLPCFAPRDLDLRLTLDAPREVRLAVRANGRPVGDVLVGKDAGQVGVRVPGAVLFRGDNALTLAASPGASPRVRLVRLTIRRAP